MNSFGDPWADHSAFYKVVFHWIILGAVVLIIGLFLWHWFNSLCPYCN